MTQEEKNLLLKDISARLPYGVKVLYDTQIFEVQYIEPMYEELKLLDNETYTLPIEEVKLYLFQMSSMTDEQEIEYDATFETIVYEDGRKDSVMTYKSFDWLNKNHFDYRDLINKGLAIDCTNLNIYKL